MRSSNKFRPGSDLTNQRSISGSMPDQRRATTPRASKIELGGTRGEKGAMPSQSTAALPVNVLEPRMAAFRDGHGATAEHGAP